MLKNINIINSSCIEFEDRNIVNLDEEEVAWTTNVASPEMIQKQQFTKASDVFMATLIIAELLTAEFTDEEFYDDILQRKENGSVEFSSEKIHTRHEAFFEVLALGLANEPIDRPSASSILEHLLTLQSF